MGLGENVLSSRQASAKLAVTRLLSKDSLPITDDVAKLQMGRALHRSGEPCELVRRT